MKLYYLKWHKKHKIIYNKIGFIIKKLKNINLFFNIYVWMYQILKKNFKNKKKKIYNKI